MTKNQFLKQHIFKKIKINILKKMIINIYIYLN